MKKEVATFVATLVGLAVAVSLGFYWYVTKDSSPGSRPILEKLNLASGSVGATVKVFGENFNNSAIIQFGPGYITEPTVISNGIISFAVPAELELCSPMARLQNLPCAKSYPTVLDREYSVRIITSGGKSNTISFTVTSSTVSISRATAFAK